MSQGSVTRAYNTIKCMLMNLGSSRSSVPIDMSVPAEIAFFSSSISNPPYFHLKSGSGGCSELTLAMSGLCQGLHKGKLNSRA